MGKKAESLFHYNFQRLLKEKSWKLADIARESGLKLTAVKVYSSKRVPADKYLRMIADGFKVPMAEFYKARPGEESKSSNAPVSAPEATVGEMTVLDLQALIANAMKLTAPNTPARRSFIDGVVELTNAEYNVLRMDMEFAKKTIPIHDIIHQLLELNIDQLNLIREQLGLPAANAHLVVEPKKDPETGKAAAISELPKRKSNGDKA